MAKKNSVVIYQAKSGAIELRGDFNKETIWATQAQIARIFGVTPQNITIHLRNIYKQAELLEKATCKESLQVQIEGRRKISRKVREYNLDVVIAVGYRINSVIGTQFRQWATKTLRSHIIDGYTINKSRIKSNYDTFLQSVADIQALLPDNNVIDPKNILELIKEFSSTWISLDAYDRESLTVSGATKKSITLTGQQLTDAISDLRTALMQKGEATDIFALEKTKHSVEGIIGHVMQSFGGKPIYPTIEEKAAHLLYFMVKNHPFVDGNKRSGAFAHHNGRYMVFLKKFLGDSSVAMHELSHVVTGQGHEEAHTNLTVDEAISQSDPAYRDSYLFYAVEQMQQRYPEYYAEYRMERVRESAHNLGSDLRSARSRSRAK